MAEEDARASDISTVGFSRFKIIYLSYKTSCMKKRTKTIHKMIITSIESHAYLTILITDSNGLKQMGELKKIYMLRSV